GWFVPDAREALVWTADRITQENRAWLLNLPKVHRETILGREVQLVHGSPQDPLYQYVMPDTPPDTLRSYLNTTKADILVTGHTHLPFVASFGKRLFINAGSVGQPRDGDPRACYVAVKMKTLKAEIVRVEYNIEGVATKIRKSNLPDALADRLFQGV
ncbi:MAG: metallophosphoesterase family protein, partial [Candidatus Aminicenantales bacterium]